MEHVVCSGYCAVIADYEDRCLGKRDTIQQLSVGICCLLLWVEETKLLFESICALRKDVL